MLNQDKSNLRSLQSLFQDNGAEKQRNSLHDTDVIWKDPIDLNLLSLSLLFFPSQKSLNFDMNVMIQVW